MDLNGYKRVTRDLCIEKSWDKVPLMELWLMFTEEVGELAAAIRQITHLYKKSRRINLVHEFGDVFSYLFQLAHVLNIDIEDMFWEHQKKARLKNYRTIKYVPGVYDSRR